ncbi:MULTISPECIES: tRNA lysidine(34) synthetase TilS [Anaerolinea]|uniref:tRNA lysidine(34) synthetase TilS n=1 Tax=Anaerolinea TaxID=233189 RepID=UPI00261F4325|nr:tRNA lysidine(34) synthetase TilS [Anaerolinea thermophila]
MSLEEKVLLNAQRVCQISPEVPLVLGVSGGADSVCLMDVLHRAGFHLIVAHFDHQLRPESAREAGWVRDQGEQRGLRVEIGQGDVQALAKEKRMSIEEAAREARYAFLFGLAQRTGAQAVAVAHTASDQVETVLMHLIRGTGRRGLMGMPYRGFLNQFSTTIPLVRPMLSIWREEVLAYCRERHLVWIEDPSNQDLRYTRNRLRYEILPLLQRINPRIEEAIWRTAMLLADEEEILEDAFQQAWNQCVLEQSSTQIVFTGERLKKLSPGLQRGVIRWALPLLRPAIRDVDFETVERALQFIRQPTQSRHIHLMAGLGMRLEGERLILEDETLSKKISAEFPQILHGGLLSLSVPGRVNLPNHWVVEIQAVKALPDSWDDVSRWEAFVDGDLTGDVFEVRPYHRGERFQPLGMGGKSRKISDFWVDAGLPRRLRNGWPLVCARGEVVWIPGFRLDHRYRITPGTGKIYHLKVRREGS